MLIRRRKTLVVCHRCHEDIHAGRSTAPFRRKGTGEPRDAKVSAGFGKEVTEKAREGSRRYPTSFGEGRRVNVPNSDESASLRD
jgi:hypothetical protein